MPKLLISGRGGEQIHEFAAKEVVLGCDPACDIVVQGADVSPEHCKLQPVMGAWKVVDLESDAGTRVNGAYVNQRPLRSGDVLELGDVRLVFHDEGPAAASAPAAPAAGGARTSGRSGGGSARRAGGRKAAARSAPASGAPARAAKGRGASARAAPARGARDEPEDERPARRPRRQKSSGGMTGLMIVGALLLLAGGGYVVLKPKSSPNEQVFMRMQKADQAMDWEAVLREGQAGNVNDPDFGSRIAELRVKAEQQIKNDAARGSLVESTNAWNRVVLWRQDDNWKNDEEYVQRLDAFLAQFGRFGGPTVDLARKERAKITGSTGAGEASSAADAWSRLQTDLAALKANGQFGQAIQKTSEFRTKWGGQDAGLAQQSRQLETELLSDARKWLGLQISRAQHKVDQGTKLQARKILEKAADVIGIPELEDRAARALREVLQ